MKRLDEIKARMEAATEGPWTCCDMHEMIHGRGSCAGRMEIVPYPKYSIRRTDIDFIAHAREDIPFLLDHIEMQKKQIVALSKQLSVLTNENEDGGYF